MSGLGDLRRYGERAGAALVAQPLVSRVECAPGEVVACPVRLLNTGGSPAACRLSVVGLDPAGIAPAGRDVTVTVAAGADVEVVVPVAVPHTLGVGDHAAAIEVRSERPGDRPLLVPFTLAIASVAHVELSPYPATIRGRRRASFQLDVVNHEPNPVDLTLAGEAQDVSVRFREPRVQLPPGGRSRTTGKVKGPRHWSGEPTQHNVVITARGRGAATSVTAAYVQRPLFAHRARMFVAVLTVVALWLGAVDAVALWWTNRDDGATEEAAGAGGFTGSDTDGDGVLDTFVGPDGTVIRGVDTDGDGVPDAFFDSDGNPVPDPTGGTAGGGAGKDGGGTGGGSGSGTGTGGGGAGGGRNQPTAAVVRGTVTAGGDVSDVNITLAPIALGATPSPPAGIRGFAGAARPEAAKLWSARHGQTTDGTLNPVRQTQPLPPLRTAPQADGVWQFTDVPLRQSYEVVFAKPGFDTQSFVVTPPDDGSAVDLEVVLEPARGAISGTVRGPSGPLGGVAITVTDGTLTFTTTSATVGDVGTWAVDAVSTPGVYTVTATMRGYGTEVRQVTLTAGQRLTGADLNMRPGVGSISGRVVGADGQPLGGATVTAADGDASRSTSSLTEGDIGAFTIPQLDAPGTYTVQVAAPGYLTETRRVPVSGAVGGVDFAMTRTTLRLTGMVRSDATGEGIPNAGLILTTGDLTFRAATAVAPNQGSFAIDDLPPGNYTVTVEHYQHVTSTQLVTLTAGVAPPPLDIVLHRTSGPPPVGTGSLVVEVIDPSGETAAEREIKNATVRLVRTQTGEELPAVTQEAFNFRLDRIPIGTYTLLVTAPRYNPAPPRQVSIGLSEQRVQVELLRLGQASGRVIDSLTRQPLSGYFISLYRQPEDPGDAPVFTIASGATGLWQTPADSLIPGTYRVEITDAASPAGYVVRNDQLLDPAVVGVGSERFMRFVLAEGVVDPVSVADIEADPLPTITGRAYRPTFAAGTPTPGLAGIAFEALDRNDLAVTMSCPGGTTTAATIQDLAGNQGADPPLYDSFTITKEMVDAGNLTGDCTLAVSAGELQAVTVGLNGVDASNGVTSADRRVHVALTPPPPAIGGSVFWLDGATRVPIPAVQVTSPPPGTTGARVVSFTPTESAEADAAPAPLSTPGSATGTASGQWDLDGQSFGVADYLFQAADFAPGTVRITVQDGVATAVAGDNAVVTANAGRFDVQLSAPTPRTLRGTITILTTDGSLAFDDLAITATSPTGETITEAGPGLRIVRGTPSGDGLPFSIDGASPGTWSVDVSVPANHAYFGDPPPVTQLVPPGAGDFAGFDASLVELGTLRLDLFGTGGGEVAVPPTVTLDDGSGTPIQATLTAVAGDPNRFELAGIPVDPTDPIANARTYTLSVDVPGYDATRATVTIDPAFDESPAPPSTGAAVIGGLRFHAGAVRSLRLDLPRYGTLAGEVVGVTGESPPVTEPVDVETEGALTVVPVDVAGNPLPAGAVDPDDLSVTVDGNGYEISGPQGYYRIAVSHPEFSAGTVPVDDLPPAADDVLAPSPVPGVFRIVNDLDNTPADYVLTIVQGSLELTAVASLATPTPVTDVTYTLRQGATVVRTGALPTGSGTIPGLFPGDYTLEVRRFDPVDPGREIAFPVITAIRIERATPDPGGGPSVPSVTRVRAPLPPLQPSVIGHIVAVSSNGAPVPLPADAALYVVTSTYDEPAVEIDGTTTVPDPSAGDATAGIVIDDAATGDVAYTFQDVPVGSHEVTLAGSTLDALDGYELVGGATAATQPMVITASGVNTGPEFELRVPDVALTIQLSPGDYPDRTRIVLTSPSGAVYGFDGATTHAGTTSFDEATDRITIAGVAPEIGDFTLDFADALHAPVVDATFPVLPDTDGDGVPAATASVTTTGTVARVSGAASQRDTASLGGPLGPGATITLTSTSDPSDVHTFTVAAGGTASSYVIDIPLDVPTGTYDLVAARPGYTQQARQVTVTAGRIATENVEIDRLATFTVTITNTPLPSGTSVVLLDQASTVYTGTQSGNVFTFQVAPANYRIRAQASGYADALNPPTGSITAGIGDSISRSLTLTPRTVTLTVNGATPPPGTSVVAHFGAVTVTDSTAPFSFSSAGSPAIPVSGAGSLVVSAPGYRTRSVAVDDQPTSNLTTTISPLVTLTGSIAGVPDATEAAQAIGATSGTDTIWGSIDDGEYTIEGLDVGTDGADRTWTLTTYDVLGVGVSTGTSTVTVTSTNDPSGPTITVTPAEIQVTFSVTAGGSPASGVTIGFAGTSSTTGATGAVTIPTLESATDLTYTVTGDGYLVHGGGTVPAFTSRAAVDVPVTVTARPPIAGTVADDEGAVTGATVRICPAPAATICSSGNAVAAATSGAGGAFSISPLVAAGSYRVWARDGGPDSPSGSVALTVNADRSHTFPDGSAITIPADPP